MNYREIPVECPRCNAAMQWALTTLENPHIIDYHCSGCAWKGDYNHLSGQYDEYSAEDYVFSENWSLKEVLQQVEQLPC